MPIRLPCTKSVLAFWVIALSTGVALGQPARRPLTEIDWDGLHAKSEALEFSPAVDAIRDYLKHGKTVSQQNQIAAFAASPARAIHSRLLLDAARASAGAEFAAFTPPTECALARELKSVIDRALHGKNPAISVSEADVLKRKFGYCIFLIGQLPSNLGKAWESDAVDAAAGFILAFRDAFDEDAFIGILSDTHMGKGARLLAAKGMRRLSVLGASEMPSDLAAVFKGEIVLHLRKLEVPDDCWAFTSGRSATAGAAGRRTATPKAKGRNSAADQRPSQQVSDSENGVIVGSSQSGPAKSTATTPSLYFALLGSYYDPDLSTLDRLLVLGMPLSDLVAAQHELNVGNTAAALARLNAAAKNSAPGSTQSSFTIVAGAPADCRTLYISYLLEAAKRIYRSPTREAERSLDSAIKAEFIQDVRAVVGLSGSNLIEQLHIAALIPPPRGHKIESKLG